ncbi:uncharacterized protein B0H64DRAFT_119554 [Chaetomium fimeti]|uniref:Zn(2)-C6 fungal-type domain-containing protein n=1 Tax=Chaetomium fimeti TaxID=1854472 RepID=A0AAE0LTP4_9PEZI|nr:hypothetical protein B0H64DRAFT_119554 [Chaetomium fimeti]
MRRSLRRSCAACAKSKHSCDLATPRCSRCTKRKVQCVYANEPLTAALLPSSDESGASGPLVGYKFPPVDPFESYPSTRLPRVHVQRLIHSFLHKIAFQYYPLDLNATTNPFLVSWWPLALGDPALFHVSLQTACLDEELIAQRGFHNSEILMADSVALLRRKVENTSLAVQDGTMNSVITLATIEFGKGNIEVAQMHVDGVKRLVGLRGGINSVRQTSPLTARMVSWVSMLIMGHPQFDTQDDMGTGHGIPPTPEWQLSSATIHEAPPELTCLDIDREVNEVFIRLRSVFQRAQQIPFTTTRLHDLACFVIHRLLPSVLDMASETKPLTECVRYAIILYMFIMQGPTYFTHVVIFSQILGRLVKHLQLREQDTQDPITVWFLAVGMVASTGTPYYSWFRDTARVTAVELNLSTWDDASAHVKSVLWLETRQGEDIFRPHWDAIFNGTSTPEPSDLAVHGSPNIPSAAFI